MLKKFQIIGMTILVLSISFLLVSPIYCSEKAEITLRFAHEAPEDNPRHLAAIYFADFVEKETEGRVKVEVYHSGQLGSERELVEAVSIGTNIDITMAGAGEFSTYVPELQLIEMPYLFPDYAVAHVVIDGPIGKKLTDPLIEHNIRVLAFWENGFRHITNNVRPINTPEDLKGLKIRTNKSKMRMATFAAYGATPVPIDFPELYMALSQGVVDGQENPLSNIYYAKFQDVQKYLSLTGHVYGAFLLAISESTWKKLPDDIKYILLKAAITAGAYHRSMILEEDRTLVIELEKEGMKVNKPPSIVPFQKIAKEVWAQFAEEYGEGLVKELLEAAGAEY